MRIRGLSLFKVLGVGLFSLVLVGLAVAMPLVKTWWQPAGAAPPLGGHEPPNAVRLVGRDTLAVPADVVQSLGLRTAEVQAPTRPRSLPPLPGSLALDTSSLARVHARFAGEVVELGTLAESQDGETTRRPLRYGDKVEKGQLLAVVWSKDLGEKKSELVDAVSRLRLDQEALDRTNEAYRRGAVPERSVREAERNVEADQVAVARAERTLRSWRLSEKEIEEVKAEVDRLRANGRRDRRQEDDWARVEVRAPLAGTILEKNVAVGDIVDTAADLFKVADLGRLSVWASVYEEDLPLLKSLPRPVRWRIRLKASPDAEPLTSTTFQVGDILDPNQRTALVMIQVDNPRGELRVGQFVTATADLPASPDELEVPTAALIEDGRDSVVFVQPEADKPRYALRRVKVLRRQHDLVCVEARPRDDEPLRRGDRVVTAGALLLNAALEDLRATARAE